MPRRVTVVPHAVSRAREFTREASAVRECLGANTHEAHHIGSTAIPGIFAKPIIDTLAAVEDIEAFDGASLAVRRAGYESHMDGKDAFIKGVDRVAVGWWSSQQAL